MGLAGLKSESTAVFFRELSWSPPASGGPPTVTVTASARRPRLPAHTSHSAASCTRRGPVIAPGTPGPWLNPPPRPHGFWGLGCACRRYCASPGRGSPGGAVTQQALTAPGRLGGLWGLTTWRLCSQGAKGLRTQGRTAAGTGGPTLSRQVGTGLLQEAQSRSSLSAAPRSTRGKYLEGVGVRTGHGLPQGRGRSGRGDPRW